jgi:hypothetical protein
MRTGRLVGEDIGVSAIATEKLGCDRPGCRKYLTRGFVPAHRRRDEDGAGYAGLGRRKVRDLHDIVLGQLVRQWGIGRELQPSFACHKSCLA